MEKSQAYNLIEDYYRKNFKSLVNKLKGRSGSRHNAEDVVQEAFTRALTYWKSYDPDLTPFNVWFSRILENSLRTFNTERRSQGMVSNANPSDLITYSPNAFLRRHISEIKEDVNNLPDHKREIMSLAFFQGYSPLDISKILNIGHSRVKTAILRYRGDLKHKYGKDIHR